MSGGDLRRRPRTRQQPPRSMPWTVEVVAVDTTWGELQPLEIAPGVRTVGEAELVELVGAGAVLVDSRTAGSFGGRTIPGSVLVPHDRVLDRRHELDPGRLSILFCNGP